LKPLRGTSRQVVKSVLGQPDYCGDAEDDACDSEPEWAYFFAPDGVTDNGDGTLTVLTGGIDALIIVFAKDQTVSDVAMKPQR
jgi:hypothetical protein